MKLFLFVCVATQLIVVNSKIPSGSPEPCHKSDPNYKSCILKYLHKLLPLMSAGIPEYNIPPMDPLDVPILVVNRTINDKVTVNGILKNLRIIGLSQITTDDLKVDVENLVTELKLTNPHVYISVECKLKGRVQDTPLEGHGYLKGNFTDIKHNLKVSLKTFKKDGVKYFAVDKLKYTSRIGDAFINLTAKNSEQQPFADFLENLFNQHAREFLDRLNPFYNQRAGDLVRSVLNRALVQVPAEKLLPE